MLALLSKILHTLAHPNDSDPIKDCPQSVLFLLSTKPDALRTLAHTKLHTYPFASVPACWRRLYTDSSIAVAVKLIKGRLTEPERNGENSPGEEKDEKADEEWVSEVVGILDMAIIMAGAEGRGEMIETLIGALQDHVKEHQLPQKKRRKVEDAFPVDLNGKHAIPIIHHPVRSISDCSMYGFEKYLALGSAPLVMKDGLGHWPALHERPWSSPAYLIEKTFGGRRLIPVEVGRSYTDEGWGQSIITFREFIDKYLLSEKVEEGSGIGYLAQHDLFSQIPSLRNDISIPIHCYTELPPGQEAKEALKLEDPLLNAWFGPAGTVSPLHTDPYHNILCQVVGKKYIRLYSPAESEKVYPRGIEEGGVDMSNTSEVDVEAPSAGLDVKFPLFREAKYVETILSEGECLYIPVGWWHYVRSLTVSFSVSFWWN